MVEKILFLTCKIVSNYVEMHIHILRPLGTSKQTSHGSTLLPLKAFSVHHVFHSSVTSCVPNVQAIYNWQCCWNTLDISDFNRRLMTKW